MAPQRHCSACGAENPRESRFCATCGTPQLAAERAAPLKLLVPASSADWSTLAGTLRNERREVTVMFVDTSNFTAASSRLDSEDVYTFVNEAMQLLVDVVSDYDGTIDKFTGDGLMALFGAPTAHENDAERAVRAAWEMQRVIRPFRERVLVQYGFHFRIRIGIHTGEVVAGRIGGHVHAEYTVIGDTVNLAARLQTAAEADSVVVSARTYEQTSWNFRYEPLPPLRLKGLTDAVSAYRLAGLRSHVGVQRGLPGIGVPMIGRDASLTTLQDVFRSTSRDGQLQVAVISGEAGLGKTRLVHEFLRGLDGESVRVTEAKCLPFSRSRPLSLVAELVRSVAGIDDNDPPQAHVQAVHAFVARTGLPALEVTPYLLSVLGIAGEAEGVEEQLARLDVALLQHHTHVAVRRLLLAEGAEKPLVLILDDLHWIDSASRDFLQFLLQSAGRLRLMMLLVSRTVEGHDDVQPLVETASKIAGRVAELQLAPLPAGESRKLVATLIPGDSADVRAIRRRIVSRAEGVPFYIEELVRMLIDRGGLHPDGTAWSVAPEAIELLRDVPTSLRGLMLARFDGLPNELRKILQQASVIGRSFPVSLLQELTGEDGARIAAALDELETREFLHQQSFGLERGYAFVHSLVADAIRGTILKRDRLEQHERVAQAVQEHAYWPAAELNDILAYHFGESAHPEKAVPYLIAGAEYAARRYANDTVVDYCRRALAILPARGSDFFRAQLALGRALKFLGKLPAARAALEEAAHEMVARMATTEVTTEILTRFVETLRELADVKAREGRLDEAYAHLEEASLALAPWQEQAGSHLRHTLTERMAWTRFRQGRLSDSLMLADGLAHELSADPNADPTTLASVFNTIGGVLWQFGKLDAATNYVSQSLTLYHKLGDLFGKANAHRNLGILNYALGRWPEAADHFERADWLRREIGAMPGRATNLYNLAVLRMAMGEHEVARVQLEESLRAARQLGEELDIVHALIGLADLAVIQSRWDDASDTVVTLETTYGGALCDDDRAEVRRLSALICAHRLSLDEALTLAAEALTLARESGSPQIEADCQRVLGSLRARTGDRAGAESALRASVDLSVKMGDPYRQALALLELGSSYPDARGEDGAPAAEDAARLLLALGAVYDLERAMAAMRVAEQTADPFTEART